MISSHLTNGSSQYLESQEFSALSPNTKKQEFGTTYIFSSDSNISPPTAAIRLTIVLPSCLNTMISPTDKSPNIRLPKTMLFSLSVGSIDAVGTYPIKNTVWNKIKIPTKNFMKHYHNFVAWQQT